jgi:hypothetical protein
LPSLPSPWECWPFCRPHWCRCVSQLAKAIGWGRSGRSSRFPAGGVGAASSALNKGGGPRVPTRSEMKIYRMSVPINLCRVLCSGMLCRLPPLGASCLEIAGLDGIQLCAPMFLFDRLV